MNKNITIVDTRSLPVENLRPASSIPKGQVFTGKLGTYPEFLFAKTYSGSIISLHNPFDEWGEDVTVTNYKPANIRITVLSDSADETAQDEDGF